MAARPSISTFPPRQNSDDSVICAPRAPTRGLLRWSQNRKPANGASWLPIRPQRAIVGSGDVHPIAGPHPLQEPPSPVLLLAEAAKFVDTDGLASPKVPGRHMR